LDRASDADMIHGMHSHTWVASVTACHGIWLSRDPAIKGRFQVTTVDNAFTCKQCLVFWV